MKTPAKSCPATETIGAPPIAHLSEPDADLSRLGTLARSAGPLRRVALAVAGAMVEQCGWERLGFARIGDYATERLGLSGRTLLEWARVERSLAALPQLEAALTTARLPWSKVRMVARFAGPEDEGQWIAHAETRSVRVLERELRAVDRAAVPGSGSAAVPTPAERALATDLDEDGLSREPRASVRVRVPTRVAFAWNETCRVAAQVAGERIPRDVALELVTAEVLSAVPAGGGESGAEGEPREARGLVPRVGARSDAVARESAAPAIGTDAAAIEGDATRFDAEAEAEAICLRENDGATPVETTATTFSMPAFVEPLVAGLDDADAFELDARLRRIVRLGQRLDAEIAPLLRRLGRRAGGVSAAVRSLEAVARETLGLSARKARALARLDRLGDDCPTLRRAFREATLSWVQAQVLAPLFVSDGPEPGNALDGWREAWVGFAASVTVRRLEDVVGFALVTGERDPERADAGLDVRVASTTENGNASTTAAVSDPLAPPGAGAPPTSADPTLTWQMCAWQTGAWQTCARPTDPDDVVRITIRAPRDVARLFQATLATVRKRLEPEWGRLPTEGEAFAVMIEHARATWEAEDPSLRRYRRRHRVFERDSWQCTVPGCRSRRNLQAHHIVFRSAGGGDELSNQTTLCAFHHHRGVHAARVAIRGHAPDGLDFELGLRAGQLPLMAYRSGDRLAVRT